MTVRIAVEEKRLFHLYENNKTEDPSVQAAGQDCMYNKIKNAKEP